jgi:uncharacterized protein YukJ
MVTGYGVLRGTIDRWVREDGDSSPHLQIRVVDATGQPWRIAVNVQSDTGSEVVYWLVDPLQAHPVVAGLDALPSGFSSLATTSTTALDYVRAPFFEWNTGTALPATGSASADDLQDLLELHLRHCRDAGGEEFGNTDGLHGIHDIHFNQGNVGAHVRDNGARQDGGLILALPDRHAGIFLAFQVQRVPTDDQGAATPASRSIGELIQTETSAPASTGTVYLERALLNPSGDDAGHEVVVIGNLATAPAGLQGWHLVDKNHRSTALDLVTVAPGASALVALDGAGVQLSNKGGNLVLLDQAGHQVDAVVYTAADAGVQNQYLRFHR